MSSFFRDRWSHSIDGVWENGEAFTFMTFHISIHSRHPYENRPNRPLTDVNHQMARACRCYKLQNTSSVTSSTISNFLLSDRWCWLSDVLGMYCTYMISPVREPVSDMVVTIRWSRYDVHIFTCRTFIVWQMASVVRLCRYVRSSIRKGLTSIFLRGLSGSVKPIPFAVVVEFCYRQRSEHLRYRTVIKVKVKWSRYRPGVAQSVGRGIALLFHDRGTRTGWVVSSTPRPHFTPGKVPVPILQEAGWAPGPVWTGGKSRPHRDSIPACSQSLYRLSYPDRTVMGSIKAGGITVQLSIFWFLTENSDARRWLIRRIRNT